MLLAIKNVARGEFLCVVASSGLHRNRRTVGRGSMLRLRCRERRRAEKLPRVSRFGLLHDDSLVSTRRAFRAPETVVSAIEHQLAWLANIIYVSQARAVKRNRGKRKNFSFCLELTCKLCGREGKSAASRLGLGRGTKWVCWLNYDFPRVRLTNDDV